MFYKTFQKFYTNCKGSATGLICEQPVIYRKGSNYSVKKDFYVKPVTSALSDSVDDVKANVTPSTSLFDKVRPSPYIIYHKLKDYMSGSDLIYDAGRATGITKPLPGSFSQSESTYEHIHITGKAATYLTPPGVDSVFVAVPKGDEYHNEGVQNIIDILTELPEAGESLDSVLTPSQLVFLARSLSGTGIEVNKKGADLINRSFNKGKELDLEGYFAAIDQRDALLAFRAISPNMYLINTFGEGINEVEKIIDTLDIRHYSTDPLYLSTIAEGSHHDSIGSYIPSNMSQTLLSSEYKMYRFPFRGITFERVPCSSVAGNDFVYLGVKVVKNVYSDNKVWSWGENNNKYKQYSSEQYSRKAVKKVFSGVVDKKEQIGKFDSSNYPDHNVVKQVHINTSSNTDLVAGLQSEEALAELKKFCDINGLLPPVRDATGFFIRSNKDIKGDSSVHIYTQENIIPNMKEVAKEKLENAFLDQKASVLKSDTNLGDIT